MRGFDIVNWVWVKSAAANMIANQYHLQPRRRRDVKSTPADWQAFVRAGYGTLLRRV